MADRDSTHARVTGSVELKKRKRGDVYYLRYRLPSGKQVMKRLGRAAPAKGGGEPGTFTKRQAEDALKEVITDVRRGAISDPIDTSGKTLADAVAAWLFYVQHDKARKPSTVRGYRQVGALLEAEFGAETPIEKITTEKIDDYRSRLLAEEDGVSRRTVQQRLVLMRGIMQRAKMKRWIPVNPVDAAEKVNVPRSEEFNVLTVEQVEAVARHAEPMFAAAITVAAYTGLRTGELRALRWRDVDFEGSVVRVVRNKPIGGEEGAPKSGKARPVPLIDQAARVLDGLSKREDFTGEDDRVFVNEVGGMLGDDALRDALYDAMEAAKIDRLAFPAGPFRFHDLRHSYGTMAAGFGFSLHSIKAWMGHADISTTERYAHYMPQADFARQFSEKVAQASGIQPSGEPSRETSREPR